MEFNYDFFLLGWLYFFSSNIYSLGWRGEIMTQKIVNFYYKRENLPHSEYTTLQSLAKFLGDDTKTFYKISTSTAAIFILVRAFCLKNKIKLVAQYEDISLTLDKNMRMKDWFKCPDFYITDAALDDLLDLGEIK